MSPSEFDLRAALHHGEGEPLDADRVVAAGRVQHARRRAKLRAGAAGAAVVVGVIGVGAAVFSSRNGSQHESAGANRQASGVVVPDALSGAPSSARSPKPNAAAGQAEPSAARAANPAASCPNTAPRPAAPAAANPAAPLFPKPVASVLVCAYAPAAKQPAALTLTGARAQELANSLDHAARAKPAGACPSYVLADQRQLTIIARSADGTALAPVTTTLNAPACRVVVTHGAAVRYGWTPSAEVAAALRSIAGTPHRLHGSPAVS